MGKVRASDRHLGVVTAQMALKLYVRFIPIECEGG